MISSEIFLFICNIPYIETLLSLTVKMTVSESIIPPKISSKEQAQKLIDDHDNFLFDCDGVIWLDEKLIPGVLSTIEYLQSKNKRYVFVTNNSSKSRQNYVEKFQRLGFKGITKDMIYPTCYAATFNLKEHLKVPEGSKIWVLGDSGIEDELREANYIPVGGTDDRLNAPFDPHHELLKVDPDVKAVVVGSTKDFNYMRIALTLQYLLHDNKSIPFIGANIDRSYPSDGLILPAGGSVVNYMQYTADRDFINVGKPSTTLLDVILEHSKFDKEKTIMVGDTLYTDIKFGNDGQLANSLLVFSGGTTKQYFDHFLTTSYKQEETKSMIPLCYIESFGDIIDLIN